MHVQYFHAQRSSNQAVPDALVPCGTIDRTLSGTVSKIQGSIYQVYKYYLYRSRRDAPEKLDSIGVSCQFSRLVHKLEYKYLADLCRSSSTCSLTGECILQSIGLDGLRDGELTWGGNQHTGWRVQFFCITVYCI